MALTHPYFRDTLKVLDVDIYLLCIVPTFSKFIWSISIDSDPKITFEYREGKREDIQTIPSLFCLVYNRR